MDLTAVGGTTSMSLLICVHTHMFWCSPDAWAGSDMSVCLLCFDCDPPCKGGGGLMLSQWTQLRHPQTSSRVLQDLSRTYDTSLEATFLLQLPHRSPLLLLFLSLPLFSFLLLLTEPVCYMRLKGLSAQLDVVLRCQNKYWCSDSRDVNQFLLQFTFP